MSLAVRCRADAFSDDAVVERTQMSGAFVRYLSELESGLATLSSDSRLAVMLSACERMFFVAPAPGGQECVWPGDAEGGAEPHV